MKTKDIAISILITLVLAILVFFVGSHNETLASPVSVYQVYLNGKVIGYLDSKQAFLDLVNEKQKKIKEKYGVDKVYPPAGLKIEEIATYENDIKTPEEIYNTIENTDPFTIDRYVIKVKYKDEKKNPIIINVIKKEDFEKAFYNTMAAFVGRDALDAYKNNTQAEINETGSKIESIYWDENITTKESYISTEENIFTNSDDLSKYLLFGTTKKQKTYTVKEGDSITDIVNSNNLSIEEFLIANPNIPNANILLTSGEEVNIGLISPIVTIVHEKEVVEDIINNYSTEYKDDDTMYYGTTKTIQTGSNGTSRVTEQVQYKNGAIEQLFITKNEEITPTTNEIIARGTKSYDGNYVYVNTGNENWYWPTVSPYIITSPFGYRWGKQHKGIDISGCGFGSPIYSATDGTVVDVGLGCSSSGSGYGDYCNAGYGNYVSIASADGKYVVIYMHLRTDIVVKVGQSITRQQKIGTMGNSGSSTGTHLHFQIDDAATGTALNPCRVAFSC
jgi:murein DD-endopeptidase MepM/ murein hydrolase activator NlpD